MPTEEESQLIKKYAPILWFHEDDAFLPEDCKVMERVAKIGRPKKGMKDFRLDDLGRLRKSEDYYMDIPGVDFANFGQASRYQGPHQGPEALSHHFREKYGNNPFLIQNPRPSRITFHARVNQMRVRHDSRHKYSDYIKDYYPEVFGDYQVIQYFFYYLYNDAWNQHIGDWDSTMELFIKDNESQGFAVMHMHEILWMVRFGGIQKLPNWIKTWQSIEKKKEKDKKDKEDNDTNKDQKGKKYEKMGKLYYFDSHPFVFVAKGAHGGYPTPGYSVHGVKIPKIKIVGQTDYRQIGKTCLLPDDSEDTRKAILKKLDEGGIDTSKTRFFKWEEPVVLENQPWLSYKGAWGAKSDYQGWGGPTGPAQKDYWEMNERYFKNVFYGAVHGDYTGGILFKVLKNWHGW